MTLGSLSIICSPGTPPGFLGGERAGSVGVARSTHSAGVTTERERWGEGGIEGEGEGEIERGRASIPLPWMVSTFEKLLILCKTG